MSLRSSNVLLASGFIIVSFSFLFCIYGLKPGFSPSPPEKCPFLSRPSRPKASDKVTLVSTSSPTPKSDVADLRLFRHACEQHCNVSWIASLHKHEKRVFSQNGEDGIIENIFTHIRPDEKDYVEFGVENGMECNTRLLRETKGWKGIMMDGGDANVKIGLHSEMITFDNIVSLFEKYQVRKDVDLISIDIDSFDLWVWRELLLAGWRGKLVIIEFNRNIPDGISLTMPRTVQRWKGNGIMGASLTALQILAAEFDYELVHIDKFSVNAFFIPSELLCCNKEPLKSIKLRRTYVGPLHPPPPYDPGNEKKMAVYLGAGKVRDVDPELYEALWRRNSRTSGWSKIGFPWFGDGSLNMKLRDHAMKSGYEFPEIPPLCPKKKS